MPLLILPGLQCRSVKYQQSYVSFLTFISIENIVKMISGEPLELGELARFLIFGIQLRISV